MDEVRRVGRALIAPYATRSPAARIYSIHHAGRHGGGHAGYSVSPVHDYRNVSDCGLGTWREGNALARELPAHEIGHCVESASGGPRI